MKTLMTIGILSILATSASAASLRCLSFQAPESNNKQITNGTFNVYYQTEVNVNAGGEIGAERFVVQANIPKNRISLSSFSDDKGYVSTVSTEGKASLTFNQNGIITSISCILE